MLMGIMGLEEVQINTSTGLGLKFIYCIRLNPRVTQTTECSDRVKIRFLIK